MDSGPGLHRPYGLPLSIVQARKSVQLVMEYTLGGLRDYLPRHNVGPGPAAAFSLQICEVGGPPLLPEPAPSLTWPELPIPSVASANAIPGRALLHPCPSSRSSIIGPHPRRPSSPAHVIPTAGVVPPSAWLSSKVSRPQPGEGAPPCGLLCRPALLPRSSAVLPASPPAWSRLLRPGPAPTDPDSPAPGYGLPAPHLSRASRPGRRATCCWTTTGWSRSGTPGPHKAVPEGTSITACVRMGTVLCSGKQVGPSGRGGWAVPRSPRSRQRWVDRMLGPQTTKLGFNDPAPPLLSGGPN